MQQLPATTRPPPERTAPRPSSRTVADIGQEHQAIGELERLHVGNGDGLVVLIDRERVDRLLTGPHMTGGADLAEVLVEQVLDPSPVAADVGMQKGELELDDLFHAVVVLHPSTSPGSHTFRLAVRRKYPRRPHGRGIKRSTLCATS